MEHGKRKRTRCSCLLKDTGRPPHRVLSLSRICAPNEYRSMWDDFNRDPTQGPRDSQLVFSLHSHYNLQGRGATPETEEIHGIEERGLPQKASQNIRPIHCQPHFSTRITPSAVDCHRYFNDSYHCRCRHRDHLRWGFASHWCP